MLETTNDLSLAESRNGVKPATNSHPQKNTMQKSGSKQMLVVCFAGIFISYFIYGFLQEKITKGHYGEEGEKFTYMLALVFCQCVVNAAFAQVVIKWSAAGEDTSPHIMYAIMSFSYLGAMVCSNKALQYVSYPTQVLGKSAKPIPVMLLGVVLARKKYPLLKYLFVLMIVIGVALFMYKDKNNSTVDSSHTVGFGEILLLISLSLDGVTGGIQDKIRADYVTQTHRMMLNMNLWSLLYSALGLILTGEGVQFVAFATKYPIVLFNLLTFAVCSAIGQNFIFLTVMYFGPLTCSIFTTTRKFFTILGSVFLFNNPMSIRQWFGTSLVFAGLGLDATYGKGKASGSKKSSYGSQQNSHKSDQKSS